MWVSIFLPFLSDLDVYGSYSWGSTILAFLYRSLCKASGLKVDGVNGELIILQTWAWSRFFRSVLLKTLETVERIGLTDGGGVTHLSDTIRTGLVIALEFIMTSLTRYSGL